MRPITKINHKISSKICQINISPRNVLSGVSRFIVGAMQQYFSKRTVRSVAKTQGRFSFPPQMKYRISKSNNLRRAGQTRPSS